MALRAPRRDRAVGLLGLTVRASVITLLAALGLAASTVTASAADCTFTFQTNGTYLTVCPGAPGGT